MLTRIAIAGAGRMGVAIARQIAADPALELTAVWARDVEAAASRFPGAGSVSADLGQLLAAADCVIDFSLPAGSVQVAARAADEGRPLVCGVSGLDPEQFSALEQAAERIPVVFDRNMSQGVAVLTELVRQAAAALGPEYRAFIDETHHVHKLDAPSGTALKLGEAVAGARGGTLEELMWYAPETPGAEPPEHSIRFTVERRGEVPGEHELRFVSDSEQLILGHSVTTRDVFAAGALRAARWIQEQPPGLYAMRDVLGLDTR